MAIDNRTIKIKFPVDGRVKEIELPPTELEKQNHIINNNLDYDDAITYLDDTVYKIWDRPQDPPPF